MNEAGNEENHDLHFASDDEIVLELQGALVAELVDSQDQ